MKPSIPYPLHAILCSCASYLPETTNLPIFSGREKVGVQIVLPNLSTPFEYRSAQSYLSLIGTVNHVLWQVQTRPFINNFLKESKGCFKYSFEKMDITFTQQSKLQLIRPFWIFSDLLLLSFFNFFDVIYQIPLDNEHTQNR